MPPTLPNFTVIIPTYNRANPLERALSSLQSQTLTDFEAIVCDDGSTDHTRTVVDRFAGKLDLTYIFDKNWGGPARPRNKGIAIARGQWICFLDSDDWWYPEKLMEVSKYLENTDVIYHDMDIFQATPGRIVSRVKARDLNAPVLAKLLTVNCRLHNSSFTVRKSIMDAVGPISEDKQLIAAEDFDLWIRISRLTDRFRRIPLALGAYCYGDDNLTEISEKQVSVIEAIYRKNLKDVHSAIKAEAICFKEYSIGRIRYQTGTFDVARHHFARSIKSKNVAMKTKSLMLLAGAVGMKSPLSARLLFKIYRAARNRFH